MNLSGLANIIGNSIVGGIPGGGGGTPPQPANAWSMQTDGVDQYAESATSPYSTLDGDTNFSFSVWVKPDNFTHDRIIFSIPQTNTTGGPSDDQQVLLYIRPGGIMDFRIARQVFYVRSSVSLTAGAWQHVVISVDLNQPSATGNKASVYINGVLSVGVNNMSDSNQTNYNIFNATTSIGTLGVGEDTNLSYLNPFYGFMDEFAIWSGVTLSSTDVLGIYNQGGAGKPGNLNQLTNPPNLWYRFGDNNTPPGSGTAIPNQGSSGATDNGAAINGASFVNDTP